jgi:hypothetical protein
MQQLFFRDETEEIEITNILEIAGLNTPPVRIKTTQGWQQHGATVRSAAFEPRPFSIVFDATGANWEEAAARRDKVATFFSRLTPKCMLYKHGTTELLLCDVWLYEPYDTSAQEVSMLNGALQLVAFNPFFYQALPFSAASLETALWEFICDGAGVETPEEFGTTDGGAAEVALMEFSAVQQSVTVTNPGTSKDSPATVRFIAPATGPWVRNDTTGQMVKVGKELVEGEILVIDTVNASVKIIDGGGVEHEAFNYISDNPDEFAFITLQPGDNIFTFGSDGGGIGHIEVGGYAYFTNIR